MWQIWKIGTYPAEMQCKESQIDLYNSFVKTKLLGVALLQKYVRTLIYFLCLYSELTEETVHASKNYVGDLIMDTGHDHGHLHLNVLHEGHHHTTTGKLHMACAWASISVFNTIHT